MLLYLFQITVCWGLFALLYALVLRRETFFRANRLYLLSTLALGLLLPLGGRFFPGLGAVSGNLQAALPEFTVQLSQAEQAAGTWSLPAYLWWAYWLGVLLTGLRLLWGIFKLLRMATRGIGERLPGGFRLVRTPAAAHPFSFFRWIFVPEDFEHREDAQDMLAHERAHAEAGHSVDVLLLEILSTIGWFHPLIHWYRRSLRAVHEYQADAAASSRTDRRQYGLLLLRQTQPAFALSFANHFFQSPLKQRLLMLTRNASPLTRGWRYGLILPVLLLLLSFTQREHFASAGLQGPVYEAAQVQKDPEYPGGIPALIGYLSANIQYPAEARAVHAEGKVNVQMIIDEAGAVSSVTALPPAPGAEPLRQDMVEEAIRVVRGMPNWMPAERNGQAVACKMTLPIRFKLE